MRSGIGGHALPNQGRTNDWITPRHIPAALGEFDLDPCACSPQPWPTAKRMWTRDDDGLAHQWFGRVWLNPPYGRETGTWLQRLAKHGYGTALIFARTETEMFVEHVWRRASAVLFLAGRLHFHHPNGDRSRSNSGGPSCLVAYGEHDAQKLKESRLAGALATWKMMA